MNVNTVGSSQGPEPFKALALNVTLHLPADLVVNDTTVGSLQGPEPFKALALNVILY